jgi:prevent-host-death family protein
MIHANVADVKARLSHFLRLAQAGEKVVICERNKPIAEIVPVKKPFDEALFDSAIGMFPSVMTEEELQEALRPMTDEEADAFVEGRY